MIRNRNKLPIFVEKYPVKIAVNTRLLLPDRLDGIGRFAAETLKLITLQHPEHQFYFLFDRKYDEKFIFSGNITPKVIPPPTRHPLLYLFWTEISLPLTFLSIKPDIFLSPDGILSLVSGVKSLPVIHDLNFEYYPSDLPLAFRKYYRTFYPKFAAKASRIATVSEYTKADLVKIYKQPESKIDVVYNGVNEIFKPIPEIEKTSVRNKWSEGKPYFLFVSSLHPRKNLKNLLLAFDEFRKSTGTDEKLLIVGATMWLNSEMETTLNNMQFKDEVIFTGRVDDQTLAQLVSSALALTYVSKFEGFGIPIVEAFRSETAVITSNVTSMPEVAGDAALLVDPESVESITQSLKRLSTDEELRKVLIEKGKIQQQKFSWQNSADALWRSIERSMETN